MKHGENRMYRENVRSLNWFKGCRFNCVYCIPSFQRQARRQKHRCMQCYRYEPHAHLDRLLKAPPRTQGNEFIFFPSSGDLAFAKEEEMERAFEYVNKYSDRTFLMQTKNPKAIVFHRFPSNVLVGTTIETDKTFFPGNPSEYDAYWYISSAPIPSVRLMSFAEIWHHRKVVTIEPILSFHHSVMMAWLEGIEPEIVYVGYDNHNCRLPEPSLAKTQKLIDEMREREFTDVRVKSLRKAWWE